RHVVCGADAAARDPRRAGRRRDLDRPVDVGVVCLEGGAIAVVRAPALGHEEVVPDAARVLQREGLLRELLPEVADQQTLGLRGPGALGRDTDDATGVEQRRPFALEAARPAVLGGSIERHEDESVFPVGVRRDLTPDDVVDPQLLYRGLSAIAA